MNNEEKILEILTQMQQDISGLKVGQARLEADVSGLKADVSGLKADVSSLKTGQARLEADVSSLKTGQTKLEADVSGIKVRLDVEVQKQFDQLVDGQDQLHRKVTHVESLAEETKDTVDVIRAAVTEHSREIVKLKQVQ